MLQICPKLLLFWPFSFLLAYRSADEVLGVLTNQKTGFSGVQSNLQLNLNYRTNNIKTRNKICVKSYKKNQSFKGFLQCEHFFLVLTNLRRKLGKQTQNFRLKKKKNNSSRFIFDYHTSLHQKLLSPTSTSKERINEANGKS